MKHGACDALGWMPELGREGSGRRGCTGGVGFMVDRIRMDDGMWGWEGG